MRLAKPTSNLFRSPTRSQIARLDTSGLRDVLTVDPMARTADVQGICTYEWLVDATLAHYLMPRLTLLQISYQRSIAPISGSCAVVVGELILV